MYQRIFPFLTALVLCLTIACGSPGSDSVDLGTGESDFIVGTGTPVTADTITPSTTGIPALPVVNDTSATDTTPTSPTIVPSSTADFSTSVIFDFLWKPVSERDGNLVVLVNAEDVRVEVTGSISETLNDFGPSNGRGTTARASNSGCDFGNNVRVEFFDRVGRRIRVLDGRTSVTIPRGCDRLEFRL